MTNEIKFADTVILVDVAYVDRVAGDLSKHFGDVVGRKLPKSVVSPSRFRLILRWDKPMSKENKVTRMKVTNCWGR